jgi:hypothetical protein
MKRLFVLFVALFAVSGVALADRPLVTETPEVVGKGVVEVESGVTASRAGNTKTYSLGEVVVDYGVSKNVELSVFKNYLRTQGGASGLTDARVALKYQVNRNVALIADTTVPTGSSAYKNNYQPGATLALGKDVGRVKLLANVGYRRVDTGTRSNSFNGSLAAVTNTKVGNVFAEVYGTENRVGGDRGAVAVGWFDEVSDGVTVDARVGRSLYSVGQPNYFVGVGVRVSK